MKALTLRQPWAYAVQARLDAHSIPEPNTGCVLWVGAVTHYGYGHMKVDGRFVGTHRLAWVCSFGDIPEALHVLHKCDTPACINPAHLFLGTHRTNMQDMARKGRATALHGEDNPRSKLTAAQVAEMRGLAPTLSQRVLARRFGISRRGVREILAGRNWRLECGR